MTKRRSEAEEVAATLKARAEAGTPVFVETWDQLQERIKLQREASAAYARARYAKLLE